MSPRSASSATLLLWVPTSVGTGISVGEDGCVLVRISGLRTGMGTVSTFGVATCDHAYDALGAFVVWPIEVSREGSFVVL